MDEADPRQMTILQDESETEKVLDPTKEQVADTLKIMQKWIDKIGEDNCPMCGMMESDRNKKMNHPAYDCSHPWVYPLRFDLGFEPATKDDMAEHEAFETWLETQTAPENEGLAIELEATA